jgi:polyisoprenoid-binding protein YceI
MSSQPGTYSLGPDSATLTVKTGKTGAAAKAGHDLDIKVSSWSAQLDLGEAPAPSSMSLTADSRSLKVIAGSGGMQSLGDDDRANIEQTIDDVVLKGGAISFRSTHVYPAAGGDGELHVHGDLNLLGRTGPIEFRLRLDDDGHLSGCATVVQTAFGLKPFSALFGTLKVSDAVEVVIDGTLSAPLAPTT